MRLGSIMAMLALSIGLEAAAQPVKILNIGHGYYAGALYVARTEKLFEKHGLQPEISYVQGGALVLQALLAKQADVGIVSYEHVLTAASQGRRIVSFYNIANRPLNNLIIDMSAAAGADSLDLEGKMRLLKGRKVGLPSANGSGEKMLKVMAARYGLSLPGDITTVYLGSEPGSYVAAFQRKLIDAAVPVEPAGTMVRQAGLGKILIDVMNGEVDDFRDLIFMTLAAHPDIMRDKAPLLRKVVQVFDEAYQILRDPQRGKALMAREYPEMSADANERVFEAVSKIWPKSPKMSVEQARATFDYLKPEGPHKFELADTFSNVLLRE